MKIIVVDDEIESLSNFLLGTVNEKEIEYKFFLDNPLDALSYIKSNEIAGAFLDIRMPKIDGVSLAKQLLKINPELKIVFITGFTYDEKDIQAQFKDNLLGFCYKPFSSEKLNHYISLMAADGKRDIFFHTFGSFDLFLNGQNIAIPSTKAKELLALLVAYRGSSLTMDDCIYHLWPNKSIELAKKLYRDAVWRLRKALNENSIGDLVIFNKAITVLNTKIAHCDMWDYMDKKNDSFNGIDFMNNYDWSIDFLSKLDDR